jgi:simple sugar transport system substrate-binding protein
MTQISRRTLLQSGAAIGAMALGNAKPAMADDVLKVGIVHMETVNELGWTKAHDLGRAAMEAAFPGKIKTTIVENVALPQDAERIFRDLSNKGNKLVFATTFSHMAPLLKVAPTCPGTNFECNTAIKTLPNMGAFEARYYEGMYLAGIAAGKMTKSNVIGWVGAFPFPNVLMGINGFTQGARSVNPAAVCKVIWISAWVDPAKEKDAVTALIAQGADVVAGFPNTPVQGSVAEEKGVWSIGYASDYSKYVTKKQLTAMMLDWSSAYIDAAKQTMAGTWKTEDRWLGVAPGGYIKMAPYNPAIPEETRAPLAKAEADIASGTLHPFAGPLKDQAGTVKVAAGSVMPDSEIRGTNFLVEGVEGKLPG